MAKEHISDLTPVTTDREGNLSRGFVRPNGLGSITVAKLAELEGISVEFDYLHGRPRYWFGNKSKTEVASLIENDELMSELVSDAIRHHNIGEIEGHFTDSRAYPTLEIGFSAANYSLAAR